MANQTATETTTATLVGKIQEQQAEIERLRIKLDYIKVLADHQVATCRTAGGHILVENLKLRIHPSPAIQEFKTISDVVKA